jgi:glutathione synthase/RimK-type ligase-like ATP-grasp enzyme
VTGHRHDLVIIHEHPEWQKPLFDVLTRRGVNFGVFDLKSAAFLDADVPEAPLYFNQASPSAYVRGNTRAVPLGLAFMRALETKGARVLNGADAFALELSKSAQAALLRTLGIPSPRSLTFNSVAALKARAHEVGFPALIKPEQGGSGARIYRAESVDDVERLLAQDPGIWLPDNLLLLQEYVPYDPDAGIVRMEFLDGELLYAMRVVSHGSFNLCPSPACHPENGDAGVCEVPPATTTPVEFFPYPEVPGDAVETGRRLVRTCRIDVGGIEYLDAIDGRRVFYDVNANSNLRPSIAATFGFDPFERVADYLQAQIDKNNGYRQRVPGARRSG